MVERIQVAVLDDYEGISAFIAASCGGCATKMQVSALAVLVVENPGKEISIVEVAPNPAAPIIFDVSALITSG